MDGVFGSVEVISEALPFPQDVRQNRGSGVPEALEVTRLLGGDAAVREGLYRAVYAELRAIAARKMAAERPGHTLQPTALVNEAWLKFGARQFANRAHFFA